MSEFSDALDHYAHYLNMRSLDDPDEELKRLEDLGKAKRAMEIIWLELREKPV